MSAKGKLDHLLSDDFKIWSANMYDQL